MLFCGMNYKNHVEENPEAKIPNEPFIFSKFPSTVIGSGEPIAIPKTVTETDYEVELAFIVGHTARRVLAAQAMDYIFGYTVLNDVSARDVQFKDAQITMGKNPDTFCPMGPELVTRDEIQDPHQLHLTSRVNGEIRQSSSTSEMIFRIDELIEFLTSTVTLYPGDVVSTGTPAGVGAFRRPPVWLRPGDEVTVEVDKVGQLTNPVVAGW
jgi:2-keto-4-pentenoate hydratase/2-oxohepta-3-ene-1,7-dioic acid hydratase in catechol pathway